MKRNLIFMGMLTISICLLAACSMANSSDSSQTPAASEPQNAGEEAYHKITAEEAKNMIEATDDIIIVDVRTAEEYTEKHIPNAILVPNETIANEASVKLPDQGATLVIYCRTGVRSKQAADKLVEMGYTNVYDMGGIADWPYETESGDLK